MLLENKIAIVTGGTRGIGFAIVREFLKEGATVVLCGSRQETVDKAVSQLPGEKVEGICPDLTRYESVKAAFDEVEKKYGRIDILVNNAGVSAREPFTSYTQEMFQKTMDLNLTAVFNCSRAVVDGMKARHSGVILNTSSMVSKYAQPSGIAYPTSKFAVNGFTLSLARELAGDNIRVNAVAPGITKTDMVAALPEQMIQPLINSIPLHRIGEPEDIANAFVFLASDKASYITGQVLGVDGLART